MPRQKFIKCIASGVLGSFVSRNNDVDGYWGIGMLSRIAQESKRFSLTFDLAVSPASKRSTHPVIAAMAAKYGQMLRTHAEKFGFTTPALTRAILSIEFGTSGHLRTPPRLTRGTLFFVTLTVLNAHDFESKVFLTSQCEPHDPNKEQRSARAPEAS